MGKGGGGDLILKVIVHTLKQKAKMHIKYWLDASALLPEFSQKQRSTWGTRSVRTQLRWQNGKGQRWHGQGEKLLLLFSNVHWQGN